MHVLTITERIDAAWHERSPDGVEWLGLEDILRRILKKASAEEQNSPTLRLIDEALAAFTRRGYAILGKRL